MSCWPREVPTTHPRCASRLLRRRRIHIRGLGSSDHYRQHVAHRVDNRSVADLRAAAVVDGARDERAQSASVNASTTMRPSRIRALPTRTDEQIRLPL
jgi:hypothetical protein